MPMDDIEPRDTASGDSDWPLSRRILMAGGHERIRGGLEIFISRACDCLGIAAHCYTDTPCGGAQSIRWYPIGLWRFARRLKAYDIVWLHYGSAFDLAYLVVAKLFGKKVAVTPHLGRSWRTMRNGAARAVCNRILSSGDAIFTLYKAQPAELKFPKRLARRCTVLPTFLPKLMLEADTPRPAGAGPLRLIHMARLSAEKGSFAFLSVCEDLGRRGVPFEATIAGPADAAVQQALQTEIVRKGLMVTLVGAVPPDAVAALLSRHDVLVNLSLQDAYPLTVVEALLCEVAPVCCALPGTEEMAAEAPTVFLVDGQNAKAAAERILTIDRDAVRNGARLMRRKYGWNSLKKSYRTAFADLVAGTVPTPMAEAVRSMPR